MSSSSRSFDGPRASPMPRGPKPADVNARAVMVAKIATGEIEDVSPRIRTSSICRLSIRPTWCGSLTATRFRPACRCGPVSASTPRCDCAASTRRICTPAAPTSTPKRKSRAPRWKRSWRQAGSDFAGRDRQIWRARRCRRRHPRYRGCFRGAAQWRLCAQLRWRPARQLVLIIAQPPACRR